MTVQAVRPHLRAAPGRKIQKVLEEIALLCDDTGVMKFGVRDAVLMKRTGVSEPTVRRARAWARKAGLLIAVSGLGHTVTAYRWTQQALAAAAALIARSDQGSDQHEGMQRSGSPWARRTRTPKPKRAWASDSAVDELIDLVRDVRSDWGRGGIAVAIRQLLRQGRGLDRIRPALLAVARDPNSKTPKRVCSDGWWWDGEDSRHTQPPALKQAPESPSGEEQTSQPAPQPQATDVISITPPEDAFRPPVPPVDDRTPVREGEPEHRVSPANMPGDFWERVKRFSPGFARLTPRNT